MEFERTACKLKDLMSSGGADFPSGSEFSSGEFLVRKFIFQVDNDSS
jgi:hypothetical protein